MKRSKLKFHPGVLITNLCKLFAVIAIVWFVASIIQVYINLDFSILSRSYEYSNWNLFSIMCRISNVIK